MQVSKSDLINHRSDLLRAAKKEQKSDQETVEEFLARGGKIQHIKSFIERHDFDNLSRREHNDRSYKKMLEDSWSD